MRNVVAPLVLALSAALAACSSSSGAPAAPPAAPPVTRPAALTMNDVSVLYPLPASTKAGGYLKAGSTGPKGVLFPQAAYDQIGGFPVLPADGGLERPLLRAVGVRFDGCFPTPSGCEPQIRLVMQPVDEGGAARDSAVHLFYTLTEAELPELVAALRELHTLAPEAVDGPLDVHPSLVAQGVEGEYGVALRDLVLKYAGEQNLTRVTFFLRAPPAVEVWFFGGFSRKGAVMEPLDIVGVGKSNQRVILTETPGGHDYDFLPVETKPENTSSLLRSEPAKTAPRDQLEKTLASFLRIENPNRFGPDDLPCAGCHVATVVTAFARKELGFDETTMPDAFTSARDLTLKGGAETTPSSLRGFGFFGKKVMISRRVVNETAAVLDDFETRFPAAP